MLLAADGRIITWWGTWVECASALNRRHREGGLDGEALQESLHELTRFRCGRGCDATGAAALTAARGDPATLDLVASDGRLHPKESTVSLSSQYRSDRSFTYVTANRGTVRDITQATLT